MTSHRTRNTLRARSSNPRPATNTDDPTATVHQEAPEGGRKILRFLGLALSIALAFGVATLAVLVLVIPMLWGGVPLTVLTNSMSPGMPPGTLVVVFPVDVDDVHIGDVITYQIASGEPAVITHRVIGVTSPDDDGPRFVLKGDNNATPDPDPIRAVQVQGRVAYSLPYLGWVNSTVNGEYRWLIIGLGAGGLFAYAAWNIISGIHDTRQRREANSATTRRK